MTHETIKTYQGGGDCGQALVTLEGFIGDMDGKTIGTETVGGLFDDEGTVDASDAVTAINALIWSLERRDAEIERLRAALDAIADYPPSQEFERDERGEIKNGARAWGPGGALHHVKQIARNAVQQRVDEPSEVTVRRMRTEDWPDRQ